MKIVWGEAADGRGAGFPGLWRVAEDYVIQDRWLKEQGKDARLYFPAAHKELPSELAKLHEGDEKAVLDFARTYGALGYRCLVKDHTLPNGDPLTWIWAHAGTVRLCLRLLEGLQDKDTNHIPNRDHLDNVLREIASPQWGQDAPKARIAAGGKIGEAYWGLAPQSRGEFEDLAATIFKDIVNKNLIGLSPRLVFNEQTNSWRQVFSFQALIQMVYWHLANYAAGGRLKRCEAEGCGSLFLQTDGRQRFCPPRLDAQAESPCAVRQRQRNLRKGNSSGPRPVKAAKAKKH